VAVFPFLMNVALSSIDGSLSGAICSTTRGSIVSTLSPRYLLLSESLLCPHSWELVNCPCRSEATTDQCCQNSAC